MKKIFFILSLILCFNAYAGTSGYCGPKDNEGNWGTNCQWSLDENGQLTITGTGKMGDHEYYDAPWGLDITQINISGISNIPTHAFVVSPQLTKVTIPDTVTSIGGFAFENDYQLTNISLPSSLTHIYDGAFAGTSISSIVLPDSLFEEDSYFSPLALSSSHITNLICSDEQKSACETYLENALEYYWPEDYSGGWPPPTRPLSNSVNLSTYKKDGDKFFYQNRWYDSLSDIGTDKHFPKRIYTIDEANRVAKPTGNTVRIKYR